MIKTEFLWLGFRKDEILSHCDTTYVFTSEVSLLDRPLPILLALYVAFSEEGRRKRITKQETHVIIDESENKTHFRG